MKDWIIAIITIMLAVGAWAFLYRGTGVKKEKRDE